MRIKGGTSPPRSSSPRYVPAVRTSLESQRHRRLSELRDVRPSMVIKNCWEYQDECQSANEIYRILNPERDKADFTNSSISKEEGEYYYSYPDMQQPKPVRSNYNKLNLKKRKVSLNQLIRHYKIKNYFLFIFRMM